MQTVPMPTPHKTERCESFTLDVPEALGCGKLSVDSFPSGFRLSSLKASLTDMVAFETDASGFTAGVGFCREGLFDSVSSYYDAPIRSVAGTSGFFTSLDSMDFSTHVGRTPFSFTVIQMDMDAVCALYQGNENRLGPIMERLGKGLPSLIPDVLTPIMKMTLHQIDTCPYAGMTRRLFLEGKVLELVAHKLDQLGSDSARKPSAAMCAADVERVRHAADMLVRDLDAPPSINELARMVGMSRTKLYRIFGQVYGISPFEYLRNHRLSVAFQWLQEREVNVTEAAYKVGYTNLSHFAKAFKELFGVLPGDILRNPPAVSGDSGHSR